MKIFNILKFNNNHKEEKMVNHEVKPAKKIKKLTIEITDQAALAAAYPHIMETVTTQVPNRSELRKIVKACQVLQKEVPGVRAYYASEEDGGGQDDAPTQEPSSPGSEQV